jgi:hypothetical protein
MAHSVSSSARRSGFAITKIAGLPEPRESGRWVASDKAKIAEILLQFPVGPARTEAIAFAARKYSATATSPEEIRNWVTRYELGGKDGLKLTAVQGERLLDVAHG